jgi:competence protein ComEC
VDTLGTRSLCYGVPPPPLWLLVLYLAGLVLLGVAVARERLQRSAAVLLAGLILAVVTFPFAPRVEPAGLEVTVLDVGQGDALLVTFPNRETWLVDAGRGPVETRPGSFSGEAVGETVVVPYLRARGLKRLNRVWLSHAHLDHMGGLPAVLEEFPVGDFNVGRNPESAAYRRLLHEVRRHGVPLETHAAGERFRVGEVTAEVLWPAADYQPGREPSNNDSLVLRLCLPAASGDEAACLLLPGDIEGKIEKKLAEARAPLAATVLKVPHHGGRAAASREFLAAVRPRAAVISVGAENPFGHPFADVVGRLEAETEEVYRSDRDGSVTLRLTARGLDVWTYRSQQPRRPYPSLSAKLAACARRLLSLEWR